MTAKTLRQMYVGPDNPQTRQLVEHTKAKTPHTSTQPLAKVDSILGCAEVTRHAYRSFAAQVRAYGSSGEGYSAGRAKPI